MYRRSDGPVGVWGDPPAPLILELLQSLTVRGRAVLDIGSGEGKNAAALASAGARVVAVEYSAAALATASRHWPQPVQWLRADAARLPFWHAADSATPPPFDVVVMQGLLDCFPTVGQAVNVANVAKRLTKPDGLHVVSLFNNRRQTGLSTAHPGVLHWMPYHESILHFYSVRGWQVLPATVEDYDYYLPHPPNFAPHTHSITRFIAWKTRGSAPRIWDPSEWRQWQRALATNYVRRGQPRP